MLRTRLIAGMILGPLGLFLIFMGGWWFYITVNIILGLAVYEYSRLVAQHGWEMPRWLMWIGVFALLAVRFFIGDYTLFVLTLFWLSSVAWALWRYRQEPAVPVTAEWGALLAGFLWIGIGGQFVYAVRLLPLGQAWLLIVVVIVWGSDVFAYFAGSMFGRRPLAPRISPKKTVEGYIGGALGGIGFICLVRAFTFTQLPWLEVVLLALILAFVVTLGDLMISLIKREASLKDAGSIIPGHGGVLDRFDTLFIGGPIAYYTITILFTII